MHFFPVGKIYTSPFRVVMVFSFLLLCVSPTSQLDGRAQQKSGFDVHVNWIFMVNKLSSKTFVDNHHFCYCETPIMSWGIPQVSKGGKV